MLRVSHFLFCKLHILATYIIVTGIAYFRPLKQIWLIRYDVALVNNSGVSAWYAYVKSLRKSIAAINLRIAYGKMDTK